MVACTTIADGVAGVAQGRAGQVDPSGLPLSGYAAVSFRPLAALFNGVPLSSAVSKTY